MKIQIAGRELEVRIKVDVEAFPEVDLPYVEVELWDPEDDFMAPVAIGSGFSFADGLGAAIHLYIDVIAPIEK